MIIIVITYIKEQILHNKLKHQKINFKLKSFTNHQFNLQKIAPGDLSLSNGLTTFMQQSYAIIYYYYFKNNSWHVFKNESQLPILL